jgi:hypothetical protein
VAGAPAGGSVTCGGYGSSSGAGSLPPCDIALNLPYCHAASQSAILRTVNMLVVLDRSSGMSASPVGVGATRWDVMTNALDPFLNKSRVLINFGLDLFPTADVSSACAGDACCATPALTDPLTIPVAPGTESVPEILNTLASIGPGGGAPAAAALARALHYYTVGDGRNLCGDKYVLFATDGGPNCNITAMPSCDATQCTRNLDPDPTCAQNTNCCSTPALATNCLDDQSVLTQIGALRAAGVTTIVVGLSGGDPYAPYLNAFAIAGGKPNPDPNATTSYYAVAESANVEALADTLHSITIDLVKSCVITYAKPPDDPAKITMLVDCNPVPWEPVDGGDGSYWTLDTTTSTITLGGPICDQILNQGVNRVDYIFGCATLID